MKINHLSDEDIQKKIDEIYKEFPALKGYEPSSSCAGCVSWDVGDRFGWDAADAWDELQDLYFLLDKS